MGTKRKYDDFIRSKTLIKEQIINFKWTIENFSKWRDHHVHHPIQSNKFTKQGFNQYEWQLKLFSYKSNDNIVLIFVGLSTEPFNAFKVQRNIEFLNKKETCLVQKIHYVDYQQYYKSSYKPIKMIDLNELISQLEDDVLIVKCTITWLENQTLPLQSMTSVYNESSIDKQVIRDHLLSSFNELLNSGNISDITLVANDGTEFSAHKCVLAARSCVFKAMFKHEMRETLASKVHIQDLDGKTIKCMLEFIYTGKFEEKTENMYELFIAADKYALDILKELCIRGLCNHLNYDNVIFYLFLADQYNIIDLKVEIYKFVSKNWKRVIETEAMKNLCLTNPILYYELTKNAYKYN